MIPGGTGGSEVHCPCTDKDYFEGTHRKVKWNGINLETKYIINRTEPQACVWHGPKTPPAISSGLFSHQTKLYQKE